MKGESKIIEMIDLEDGQPDEVHIEKYLDGGYYATPFNQTREGVMDEMPAWYAMEHDREAVREVREKTAVGGDITFKRNWVDPDDVAIV